VFRKEEVDSTRKEVDRVRKEEVIGYGKKWIG
jgi:hypothetical protein